MDDSPTIRELTINSSLVSIVKNSLALSNFNTFPNSPVLLKIVSPIIYEFLDKVVLKIGSDVSAIILPEEFIESKVPGISEPVI